MSEAKKYPTSTERKSVDQLLSDLRSESKNVRSKAAESLSNLKIEGEKERETAVKTLKGSLKDLDETTRPVVTGAIERFQEPSKSK